MKLKKIVFLILCCSILVTYIILSLYDKYKEYKGDYPELYSVAINTLLEANGYYRNTDLTHSPIIEIIEQDEYGRVLFYYWENKVISKHSLIISQKSDNEYVFYYPYYNFIASSENNFLDSEIEELKEKNDWNKEVDNNKLAQVLITRSKKTTGPLVFAQLENGYRKIVGDDGIFYKDQRMISFFATDNDNKSLYLIAKMNIANDYYIIVLDENGNFDLGIGIHKLKDLYNYQSELKVFLEINNWCQSA